jgi:glycyl-tRNA synthetase
VFCSRFNDGLAPLYDYGTKWCRIKENIRDHYGKQWQMHENIAGLDAAILMHPTT